MSYYLLFILYFLDYENDVRQEGNSSNILFEFKMSPKVPETAYNVNKAFGSGIVNK